MSSSEDKAPSLLQADSHSTVVRTPHFIEPRYSGAHQYYVSFLPCLSYFHRTENLQAVYASPAYAVPVSIESLLSYHGNRNSLAQRPRFWSYGKAMSILIMGCCFLYLLLKVLSRTQDIGASVYSTGYLFFHPLLSFSATSMVCTSTGFFCPFKDPLVSESQAYIAAPTILPEMAVPLAKELGTNAEPFGSLMEHVLNIADGQSIRAMLSRHNEFRYLAKDIRFLTTLDNREGIAYRAEQVASLLKEFHRRLIALNHHGASFLGFFLTEVIRFSSGMYHANNWNIIVCLLGGGHRCHSQRNIPGLDWVRYTAQ